MHQRTKKLYPLGKIMLNQFQGSSSSQCKSIKKNKLVINDQYHTISQKFNNRHQYHSQWSSLIQTNSHSKHWFKEKAYDSI